MVTINLALTVPLNASGSNPLITPAQAWSVLLRKARQPQDFVPVVRGCTILAETPTRISAEVSFHPGVGHASVIRETCTLHPPCRLDYDMEEGSTAVNIVSKMPGGALMLTFVFGWAHPDVEEGSEHARHLEEIHRDVASGAMGNMVVTVRRMVAEGEL